MLKKQIAAAVLAGACLAGAFPGIYPAAQDEEGAAVGGPDSYTAYLEKYKLYPEGSEDIVLRAEDARVLEGTPELLEEYADSGEPVLQMGDTDAAEWSFSVAGDGLYILTILYSAAESSAGNLEQTLKLDGKQPFDECSYIAYKRTYEDTDEDTDELRKDSAGNDLKPTSHEVIRWQENDVSDPSGYVQEVFRFALSAGEHTLSLTGQSGTLAIRRLTFHAPETLKTYAQVQQEYVNKGYKPGVSGEPSYIEAEDYLYKSDVTIYPTSDRSSPATYPQDARVLRLNTVGGDKWKQAGQWITWEIDVPADGLYNIAPRFKQSLAEGAYVSRCLKIDGEIPFEEAQRLRFAYGTGWQLEALGGEEGAYAFYLTEGRHTITMEVCLGDAGGYLGTVDSILANLNDIYRDILMITGSVPDMDRDYGFQKLIPENIEQIGREYERLSAVIDEIVAESGRGSYVSLLNKLAFQLETIYEKPESIAKNLEEFKSNLGSLATWLLTAREQPLLLDRLYLLPAGEEPPAADDNIWNRFMFGAKCFLASFFNDYNNIGQSADLQTDKEIEVWIQTGRDQAQIMRQLIDDSFSSQYGIKVNLKLVAAGSLLPSVLARIGPDVALNNAQGDPINYAIRNANADLSVFPDFQEVAARFYESSLVPYTFEGKTYALPETLTFPMFFYRKDIFEELGLKVPETWDEMMALIPVLQRQNMSMAFPTGLTGYALVLFQSGGELYRDGGAESNLDSDLALDAFQEFTELFTLWQLPVEYDFPNRFRTGEMPCGIQDYTLYNNLVAFAPEIKGLWDFIPVPGKPDENGNPRRLSVAGGTNVMMMRACADPDSAWEFMKWWTSAETQAMFGVEMESALGTAAKQPTANREALLNMSWTSREAQNIVEQLANVQAVPEVPGGYYTSRIIDFAFNKTYNSLGNPVEILGDYLDELNEELARKRAEFGLN